MGMKDYELLQEKLSLLHGLKQNEVGIKKDISTAKRRRKKQRDSLDSAKKELGNISQKHTKTSLESEIKRMEEEIAELTEKHEQAKRDLASIDFRVMALTGLFLIAGLFFTIFVIAYFENFHSQLVDDVSALPFTCDSGESILSEQVKNGMDDCADGSDEANSGFWDSLTRAEKWNLDYGEHSGFGFDVFCMGLPMVLLVLALLSHGTVAMAGSLQETWVIVLGTIVCMGMITLHLPPQTDVEITWECVSGSQEILWVHVLDGYEHCLDRSDEFESGFFDDYTEAEEAALLEDGGYLVDSFQTWWAAIALVIQFAIVLPFSWVTQILVDEVLLQKLLRKGDSRRVRTEKLIRSEASKKRRRGAKKKQARENLQALIQMPKRIQGIEKSIETFDGQIEDFQRSLNSTRDEISSANDQIKHLVPYI